MFADQLSAYRLTYAARCLAIFGLVSVLLWAPDAQALDGYQDRRGVFAGFGLGGGVGGLSQDDDRQQTGFDDGRPVGLHLNAVLGGGVFQNLTLAGEGNWWIRTVQAGDFSLSHDHLSFNAVANVYLFSGFYLQGGVGFAYGIWQSSTSMGTTDWAEMGLSGKLGAGFEFFLNSNLAAGFQTGYNRHFYSNADFDVIHGGLTLRWY